LDVILNLALPFFGLILIGFVAARAISIGEEGLAWLNALVWYFALPSLIFKTIAEAPFDRLLNVPYLLGTSLSTYLIFIFMVFVSVLVFRARLHVAGIQASAASYGNIGYIGLPLSVAALGPEAAIPAILILCTDNAIQFVLVPLLATLGAKADDTPPGKLAVAILKSIFTHPFILSAIAGGIVAGFSMPIPTPVSTLLGFLTNAAGPCALFALGVTLSRRKIEGIGAELPLIICLKIIVHPLLVLAVLSLIGETDPLWVTVAVLMASMPTAANVFVMGRQYDAYVQGASSAILITSALGAVTLSVLLYLVDRQLLPVNITDLVALLAPG
jgi:hypothetical protein